MGRAGRRSGNSCLSATAGEHAARGGPKCDCMLVRMISTHSKKCDTGRVQKRSGPRKQRPERGRDAGQRGKSKGFSEPTFQYEICATAPPGRVPDPGCLHHLANHPCRQLPAPVSRSPSLGSILRWKEPGTIKQHVSRLSRVKPKNNHAKSKGIDIGKLFAQHSKGPA